MIRLPDHRIGTPPPVKVPLRVKAAACAVDDAGLIVRTSGAGAVVVLVVVATVVPIFVVPCPGVPEPEVTVFPVLTVTGEALTVAGGVPAAG